MTSIEFETINARYAAMNTMRSLLNANAKPKCLCSNIPKEHINKLI